MSAQYNIQLFDECNLQRCTRSHLTPIQPIILVMSESFVKYTIFLNICENGTICFSQLFSTSATNVFVTEWEVHCRVSAKNHFRSSGNAEKSDRNGFSVSVCFSHPSTSQIERSIWWCYRCTQTSLNRNVVSLFCLFGRRLIGFDSSFFIPIKSFTDTIVRPFKPMLHIFILFQCLFDFAYQIGNSCLTRESFLLDSIRCTLFHSHARYYADHTCYFCPFQASN